MASNFSLLMMFSPRFSIWYSGLRAEAAINAFEQVDVIARGAAGTVCAHVRLDGNCERGTDRLAQLASDAPLLAVGITAQRMQPAEAVALRSLLFGIVERNLGLEHGLQGHPQALQQLPEQKRFDEAAKTLHYRYPFHGPTWAYTMRPSTISQTSVTGMSAFQPKRMI